MYTRMLRKLEHRYGHIYMYRFRPEKRLRAWNSRALPAKTEQTRAIMHQILNNLDPDVAQFPHELITYGGTCKCSISYISLNFNNTHKVLELSWYSLLLHATESHENISKRTHTHTHKQVQVPCSRTGVSSVWS